MPKADSFDITLKTDEEKGESCMRHADVQFLAEGTHLKGRSRWDWRSDGWTFGKSPLLKKVSQFQASSEFASAKKTPNWSSIFKIPSVWENFSFSGV